MPIQKYCRVNIYIQLGTVANCYFNQGICKFEVIPGKLRKFHIILEASIPPVVSLFKYFLIIIVHRHTTRLTKAPHLKNLGLLPLRATSIIAIQKTTVWFLFIPVFPYFGNIADSISCPRTIRHLTSSGFVINPLVPRLSISFRRAIWFCAFCLN